MRGLRAFPAGRVVVAMMARAPSAPRKSRLADGLTAAQGSCTTPYGRAASHSGRSGRGRWLLPDRPAGMPSGVVQEYRVGNGPRAVANRDPSEGSGSRRRATGALGRRGHARGYRASRAAQVERGAPNAGVGASGQDGGRPSRVARNASRSAGSSGACSGTSSPTRLSNAAVVRIWPTYRRHTAHIARCIQYWTRSRHVNSRSR